MNKTLLILIQILMVTATSAASDAGNKEPNNKYELCDHLWNLKHKYQQTLSEIDSLTKRSSYRALLPTIQMEGSFTEGVKHYWNIESSYTGEGDRNNNQGFRFDLKATWRFDEVLFNGFTLSLFKERQQVKSSYHQNQKRLVRTFLRAKHSGTKSLDYEILNIILSFNKRKLCNRDRLYQKDYSVK